MASTFDGGTAVLPAMPDFSALRNFSAGDMKFHLQNVLVSKGEQLEQAATLGQRVLAQQMELEERIRQLQEIDTDKGEDDEIDSEARERYRELVDTMQAWDTENAQLSSTFGVQRHFANGLHSPSMPLVDLPREETDRSKASAGTSAAQSRRAKNAAHRADDVEFAFEIGSGLLTEVRRLQSLLAERDKAIQDMKEEKDDLEKSVENLRTALRQQEQSTDKFKEENWNLEVTLQELRTQLSDSQADTQRLEGEHKRLTKLLSASRDAGDQHKNEAERLKNTVMEMKAKHETDVAQARKHAAGLQRDKSDLQQVVDTMKNEAARAKRLPRFSSPITPNGSGAEFLTPGGDDDVFSVPASTNNRKKFDTSGLFPADGFDDFVDSSPDPSPARPFLASNHPSNELEVLQQRLSHAQRQINTLKGTLQREKDHRRKLQASPGVITGEAEEDVEDDMAFEDVEPGAKPKLRSTPYRSGGKTRGRGGRASGLTLVQRLAMAPNSPSSEFNFDDDLLESDVPPPVPPIPIRFHQADNEKDASVEGDELQDEDTEQPVRSPSPLGAQSNRASVDGMDPAFANVLHRQSSSASLPYNGSPLRQSIIAGASRGGTIGRRRGAAYQEARPSSLVGQPEALAAELGLGMAPLLESELLVEALPKDTQEFGCQTDFEETQPVEPLPSVHIVPDTVEMGIQVDPEPESPPAPAILVVTCEVATQTLEEPVVSKAEAAVQHVRVEPGPVLVSASTNTEPELRPPSPIMAHAKTQTRLVETIDIDTQTPPAPRPPEKADVEIQTLVSSASVEVWPSITTDDERRMRAGTDAERRTTITQRTLSLSRLANLTGDTTVTSPRRFLTAHDGEDDDEDDGNETETGAETDAEDYHDAPQSAVGMSTPSESLESFHSVLTMTDNDLSESEDDESIKASHMSRRQQTTTSSMAQGRPSSFFAPSPEVLYESKEISVIPVEELKPELKDISIQTDEWISPAPAAPSPTPPAVPTPVPGFSLYRVGSGAQQFQFIPPPSSASSTTPSVPIAIPAPSSVFRDSAATFGVRGRLSQTDRRQSIESAISSITDESSSRSRVPSSTAPTVPANNTLAPVDKTKPPMMVLPPPPRLPPPPSSMPPPNFIPERKVLSSKPPPRPSSPPPADLIQRATTPTFGSVLSVSGKATYGRQHGSSMPPSQQGLRQLPSTSSFRSAANAATHAQNATTSQSTLPAFHINDRGRKEISTTSLPSDRSPRSSISSERHLLYENQNRAEAPPESPVTPNKPADTSRNSVSTDPTIIHAITQTMIGEFLYKYTRRPIGKGHGDRRHKRFFWVHPYTKTLYWSSADPGSSNVSESSAKSAYIDGVRSVLDPNPMPPGLYQYSLVISTPQREMKFTAPTKERHDIWHNALKYLLSRPNALPVTSPGNATVVPESPSSAQGGFSDHARPALLPSPQSQRSVGSARNGDSWNTTPRGRNRSQLSVGGSIGKRSGTPAAEYLRWTAPESPYSPSKSFEHIMNQGEDDLDFELHGDSRSVEAFEGLENVRACCDGRHTVGHSGKEHHHHHQPTDHTHNGDHHLAASAPARPVSPAWSFRSRTGSSNSHEGGNAIFSWGRGENGKLRFGSRRSTKTVPIPDQ